MTTNGLKISEMLYSSLEDAINDDAQVPVSVDINGVKANRRVPIQLIQGYQGEGVQGVQGKQGVAGIGTQGYQGNQGNQGITGAGTQGDQGVAGIGTQGYQGNQGNQGITGAGTQGDQGEQGEPGLTDITKLYPTENYGYIISPYTFTGDELYDGNMGGTMYVLKPNSESDYYPRLTLDESTLTSVSIGGTIFVLLNMHCGGGYTTLTMPNPLGIMGSNYIANTFDSEFLQVVRIVRCLHGWAVM